MADISKEVQDFKTAIYGEDVRDSMISLAEKINNEVEDNTQKVTQYGQAEASRAQAETGRVQAEQQRVQEFSTLKTASENATSAANSAARDANSAASNANSKASLANTAAGNADTAAFAANSAASAANMATGKVNKAIEDAESATENAASAAGDANSAASVANTAADRANEAAEKAEGVVINDISAFSVTFQQAAERANIQSGDTLAVAFGKLAKFFSDMQNVAFSGSYNDLKNKPTSMTANGGNADTVDGKHAADLQNYNNLTNRPNSLPANGGNADTVDGKHATDLQNYNNLTNRPTLSTAASKAVANNLTTNAAGSVLDARQGKALNDKITSVQSGLSALNGRIAAGLHMDHFLVGSGQGILYLKLQKTDWNKAYAFIIGCRNVDYILSESIYAWYDQTSGQIKFFAEGPLKNNWSADQSSGGSNVQVNLPENSQGIVIWYGFQQIGTA